MSARTKVVAGARERSDDDLLLPRPPGVLRRFWARHPRTVDVLVAIAAFLLSAPGVVIRRDIPDPGFADSWWVVAIALIGCLALLWRRRHPIPVYVIATLPWIVLAPELAFVGHPIAAFAAYSVAAYASARAAWIAFGATAVAMAGQGAIALWVGAVDLGFAVSGTTVGILTVLIGVLIGVNVGGRRRYTEALIDRSRQLLVERDQQARLAAAAERTRIAREMHDIVSHSLTVIVALSEGAAAASSPERARQASRGAADTARDALNEMRAMLGVLREEGEERSPLEPLEPVQPAHVADTAQRAGYPVRLETTGALDALPRSVRFAVGRIVQEGVTNAMRHAPAATDVLVRVRVDADAVTVEIRNDAALPSNDAGGYGLRGLRERVEHIGGLLEAGAATGDSWFLRARLPLTPADPERNP